MNRWTAIVAIIRSFRPAERPGFALTALALLTLQLLAVPMLLAWLAKTA